MLRCCLDSLQNKYFSLNLDLTQQKESTHSCVTYISSFLKLEKSVLQEIIFVAKLLLGLQQYAESDRFVEDIVRSIAFEVPTIADGIFCEFGIEIN